MIDSKNLGEANNVVIEKDIENKKELKHWAMANDHLDSHIWIQLNHPGKQTPKFLTRNPVAPSAISLLPPLDQMFNKPKELTLDEIQNIIERFAYAAKVVKELTQEDVNELIAHAGRYVEYKNDYS